MAEFFLSLSHSRSLSLSITLLCIWNACYSFAVKWYLTNDMAVTNFWSNSHRIRPIKPLIIGVKINYNPVELKNRWSQWFAHLFIVENKFMSWEKNTFKWCLHHPDQKKLFFPTKDEEKKATTKNRIGSVAFTSSQRHTITMD